MSDTNNDDHPNFTWTVKTHDKHAEVCGPLPGFTVPVEVVLGEAFPRRPLACCEDPQIHVELVDDEASLTITKTTTCYNCGKSRTLKFTAAADTGGQP